MDTGIYVALSREIGIFRDMEVTANNIANTSTTGYQSEDMLFTDYMVPATRAENQVAFSNDVSTFRNTDQGTLQVTGNPLDAAIEGEGYFVVQTALGPRYTRNGNFKVNLDGLLVNSDGNPVLSDDNQPIPFDITDRKIELRSDGTVYVDNTPRSTIKIVKFDNPQMMQHVGKNMFSSEVPPRPADNFQLIAGSLERSNVNPFLALTHLMYIARSASDTANFINTMYTLERNASNTLAKSYT